MAKTVLLVGGYGVFGGRLSRLLAGERGLRLVVAGRSLERAQRFCMAYGGAPLAFDRDGDLREQLRALAPAIVIDAAGPFQSYGADGYRLARAVLAAGAHYLDLADDADFALGIGGLGELAKATGRVAISGASSVPAISSAAADALVTVVSVIQTIPSLALLVFMIPFFGIGAVPVRLAVFLYSLLPIVRNTHAGLEGIPGAVRESAEALGLPPVAIRRFVELPMPGGSIPAASRARR